MNTAESDFAKRSSWIPAFAGMTARPLTKCPEPDEVDDLDATRAFFPKPEVDEVDTTKAFFAAEVNEVDAAGLGAEARRSPGLSARGLAARRPLQADTGERLNSIKEPAATLRAQSRDSSSIADVFSE